MASYKNIKNSASKSYQSYTYADDLPLTDVAEGTLAYVQEVSAIYVRAGGAWFSIDLSNDPINVIAVPSADVDVHVGEAYSFDLIAEDPEGISVQWSYSVVAGDAGIISLDLTGNTFSFTVLGEAEFTVRFVVTDGVNAQTFDVNYHLVNDAPVLATIGSLAPYAGDPAFNVIMNATDFEGVPLTYSASLISGTMDEASISVIENIITFAVPLDDIPFTIRFSVTDGVKTTIEDVVVSPVWPSGTLQQQGAVTFTVPTGVYKLNIAAIGSGGSTGFATGTWPGAVGNGTALGSGGGGALAYTNDISVSPGDVLQVNYTVPYNGVLGYSVETHTGTGHTPGDGTLLVFAAHGEGGSAADYSDGVTTIPIGGRADDCFGDVAYSGGNGDVGWYTGNYNKTRRGGGGAAGTTGDGGNGSFSNYLPPAGSNGAAGGLHENNGTYSNGDLAGGGGTKLEDGYETHAPARAGYPGDSGTYDVEFYFNSSGEGYQYGGGGGFYIYSSSLTAWSSFRGSGAAGTIYFKWGKTSAFV